MHELAVAQALVEQVDAVIGQHQASCATAIRVRIGPLAGVVPELLATAFPLAAAGLAAHLDRRVGEFECGVFHAAAGPAARKPKPR